MKFPSSFLDELRSRLTPSQVIRKKVALKHNGREYTGLCPFHKEKSPSFTVSDDKGFYHCFGCAAHGDIITFVMNTEGLQFNEAVTVLAQEAGMPLPIMSPESMEREQKAASLYDVMELACSWFQQQLGSIAGQSAMGYLKKRGLGSATIQKFRLGFAPDSRNGLLQFMTGKGIALNALKDAGLIRINDSGQAYDYFRGRVMYPIMDTKNRVIAFGGRVLDDSQQPKYLNSPETPLFKKGHVLYNENHARKVALKTGKLVITEGYMDVIALDMAGIKPAVAPLGTALTETQIKRLWNLAAEPVICLDGDSAGLRAMERAAHTCLPILTPGHTLTFATLPQGMDPDDVVRNQGTEAIRNILRHAEPLSEILWRSECERKPFTAPEQIADLQARLEALTNQVQDAKVRMQYQKFFSNKLWQVSAGRTTKRTVTGSRLTTFAPMAEIDLSTCQGSELALLFAVLHHPALLSDEHHKETFAHVEFSSNNLDKIRMSILEVFDLNCPKNKAELRQHLEIMGLSADIVYLESLKLDFFSKERGDFQAVTRGWEYIVKKYYLAHLKKECEAAERESSEETYPKVLEFRKQITQLEQHIHSAELAFGDNE